MQKINKKTIMYIILIIIIVIIYYFFIKEKDYIEIENNINVLEVLQENNIAQNDLQNEKHNVNNKIVIHITGAVKKEGIYELDENSRIADCIEKAGGLTEEAYIDEINLAYILQDGMKIYIPKKNENKNDINDNTNKYVSNESNITEMSKNTNQTSKTSKVNINTATQSELQSLPGIGTSTALKIINYRKEKGKFKNIEEIKNVNGIGDSKYANIKNLIKV